MKSKEEVLRLDKLISDETDSLKSIVEILEKVRLEEELNEDVVREIQNAKSELDMLHLRFLWRYINALKHGYSN